MKSFTEFLTEADHPFRHAYKFDNAVEQKAAEGLFVWACKHLKLKAAMPEFWLVGHSHMQDAANKVTHFNAINGQVFGWFTDAYPEKVFISDRIKLANNKQARAVVVHELAHYLQFHCHLATGATTMQDLENQADAVMMEYMKS